MSVRQCKLFIIIVVDSRHKENAFNRTNSLIIKAKVFCLKFYELGGRKNKTEFHELWHHPHADVSWKKQKEVIINIHKFPKITVVIKL